MTEYLSLEDVIAINAGVVKTRPQVRDEHLLLSALARPQTSVGGKDAYPTIHDKAAALLHSLSHNHPFLDGNKRTATISTILFLERNGWQPNWEAQDALIFVLDVAQNKYGAPEIAQWLEDHTQAIE